MKINYVTKIGELITTITEDEVFVKIREAKDLARIMGIRLKC